MPSVAIGDHPAGGALSGWGHGFRYMTAYSMDQKVRDIDRAQFWSARGLNFDPNYMTAYSMDRDAERLGQKSR